MKKYIWIVVILIIAILVGEHVISYNKKQEGLAKIGDIQSPKTTLRPYYLHKLQILPLNHQQKVLSQLINHKELNLQHFLL